MHIAAFILAVAATTVLGAEWVRTRSLLAAGLALAVVAVIVQLVATGGTTVTV